MRENNIRNKLSSHMTAADPGIEQFTSLYSQKQMFLSIFHAVFICDARLNNIEIHHHYHHHHRHHCHLHRHHHHHHHHHTIMNYIVILSIPILIRGSCLNFTLVFLCFSSRRHFVHIDEQHEGLHKGVSDGSSTYVPEAPSLTCHSDNAL